MTKYVLDSSAVLALLLGERGGDDVAGLLDDAVVSTVTVAEIYTVLQRKQVSEDAIRASVTTLEASAVSVDLADARLAARLDIKGRAAGLSLDDRACLALAHRLEATALTADNAWLRADPGVPVELIR